MNFQVTAQEQTDSGQWVRLPLFWVLAPNWEQARKKARKVLGCWYTETRPIKLKVEEDYESSRGLDPV